MSKIKTFVILCAVFCSSANLYSKGKSGFLAKAPEWINGDFSKYSPEYFAFAGEGQERKNAELDAINGLTAIFGQNASGSTASSRRLIEAEQAGTVNFAQASTIDQQILQQVNHEDILGIEFGEYYVDKKSGKNYVLALMNKSKTSLLYSDIIKKNQKVIKELIAQTETGEKYTIQNYARLDFAEEIAKKNEMYLKRINVLNPESYKKVESELISYVSIHKKKLDLTEKIPLFVSVTRDDDGRITKTFQEVIQQAGFNSTLGSNERYKIRCDLNFNETIGSDGKTYFCEYFAKAELLDTFTGESIIPMSVSGREGSPSSQNAQLRAKQKISLGIKNSFQKNFDEYLQGFKYF